jgi:hypothetical protein
MIDPSAIDERIPATILDTLDGLPTFRGTRSSLL